MVNLDFSVLLVVLILSLLLFLLQKLYFKPINTIFQKREEILRENKEYFFRFLNEYNEKEKILNEVMRDASFRVGEHKEKVRKEALSEKEAILEKAEMEAEKRKREGFKKLEEEIKEGKRTVERELDFLAEELIKNILRARN